MADVANDARDVAAKLLDDVVTRARGRARDRVVSLKQTHPDETPAEMAARLVRTFSRRAGVGGAATGALSLFSLPVGLPAGVALTLATEAELLLSLLEVHGYDTAGENGRLKLYALWAGGGLADAAKSVGLKMGAEALGATLAGSLPGRIVARLNPALVRIVLRRLGLGWLPKALKLWPVLGAPIGYVVDSAALKTLGRAAIKALEQAVTETPPAEPATA